MTIVNPFVHCEPQLADAGPSLLVATADDDDDDDDELDPMNQRLDEPLGKDEQLPTMQAYVRTQQRFVLCLRCVSTV